MRDVSVLAGGTGLAQAIMVLALPVLTRLYTPDDFGVLAVYVSVIGIISVAACLRLEIAIPMPKSDRDAANLLALSLCTSAIVALVAGAIVWEFPEQMLRPVGQTAMRPYVWLLPLGVWLASSYSALQYWATRKKDFSSIARTRLTQSIGGIGAQVALGWAGAAPFGLLLGHLISSGAGLLKLGLVALKQDRAALKSISWAGMRDMFRRYDRFPKYSTIEVLANSAGVQLPVIVIAAMVAGAEAGFLMLAMRAMQVPMSLIGVSIAQVFYSRAPGEYREGTLGRFTADTLRNLFKVGVGPIVFAGILAPSAFELVFGEEWRRAGELLRWMAPWIIFQFLSSPVSMVMHVVHRQREMMWLTTIGMLLRLGPVCLTAYFLGHGLAEAYAVGSAVFYFALGAVICMRASCTRAEVLDVFRRNVASLIIWAFSGITVTWVASLLLT